MERGEKIMKRKITGICLMVGMILSLWYGMSLPVESAAAFSETEQAVDLNLAEM